MFVEDFLAMAINFRMRVEEFSLFKQAEPLSSPKSSWRVVRKPEADELIRRVGATPL